MAAGTVAQVVADSSAGPGRPPEQFADRMDHLSPEVTGLPAPQPVCFAWCSEVRCLAARSASVSLPRLPRFELLESDIDDRILFPILIVVMPPFVAIDGEVLCLHRPPQ